MHGTLPGRERQSIAHRIVHFQGGGERHRRQQSSDPAGWSLDHFLGDVYLGTRQVDVVTGGNDAHDRQDARTQSSRHQIARRKSFTTTTIISRRICRKLFATGAVGRLTTELTLIDGFDFNCHGSFGLGVGEIGSGGEEELGESER